MVKYKNDYRKLLESKGFVLNNYPEDGKFWELVIKDDEDLKQHICKVFKTNVELLDSNIDKVILQCAEDYSRCVFYYDCNLYNMETEEFMKCVENIGMIRKLATKDLLSWEEEMDNEKKQVTYNSSISGETQVTFDIQQYTNGAMFIGLMCNEDGYEEPFGNVTVNFPGATPNYCGYLNVNNMPDIEKFITDNDIGEFTGFTQRSGFCEYPLYLFNIDKLRELCPDGMDKYETNIGMTSKPETKDLLSWEEYL